MQRLSPFDKYEAYLRAVQDPPAMCDFLENVYRDIHRRSPYVLREDFSGTFALCCEWVGRSPKHRAYAVDADKRPLNYGKRHFLNPLESSERERLCVIQSDVRALRLPRADVICALNFSYGVFQQRPVFKDYLKKCLKRLHPKGIFILDCLGGMELARQLTTTVNLAEFTYTWEQEHFNPLSRIGRFAIHFQRPGEKARKRVFVYHWRMWTPVEIRDLLAEVGFQSSFLYWEGSGQVDDVPTDSQSWVAYVVGKK